jgi:hypothetical protein
LALLVPFAVACGGTEPSGDSAAEDLSVGGSPLGHFVLAPGSGDNEHDWIEEMNLHADGIFEANFGSDVSNLPGQHFMSGGTYTVDAKASKISFTGAGISSVWTYKPVKGGIAVKAVGSPFDDEPAFTMNQAPAPVTLSFAADGSATASGPLVAGATMLLHYAESRTHCRGEDMDVSPQFMVDNGVVRGPGWAFPPAVNGEMNQIMTVPKGHEIELWFELADASQCRGFDSNGGKNFRFAIAAR